MAQAAAVATDRSTGFVRGLGLLDSTMIVAGSMIGSGIFIVSADIARQVGSAGWLLMAWVVTGLLTITGDWNSWVSERREQKTDDAYVRADLTPLSTKVAGLVATVVVSDYQTVKAGDLLVQLRDDDFRAQVQQAEAGVAAGEAALVNNQRQKELQDAHIVQATEGIRAAEANITAAEAGDRKSTRLNSSH